MSRQPVIPINALGDGYIDSFTLTQGEKQYSMRNILITRRLKMAEIEKSIRYRVNVSTSVKGVKTFDCTVDMLNETMSAVLAMSDKLVAELEKRYPPQIEEKK
jgi:hypothetical protein